MNNHGLDTKYFKKKLELIIRDIETYEPFEMANHLYQLSNIAQVHAVDHQNRTGVKGEEEQDNE